MTPQKKLEDKFSNESFDDKTFRDTAINDCIETLKAYVRIEHSVAVMSDLAENQSHIFVGNFGLFFGMEKNEHSTIDSIWEEEIYNKIHPDDLFERHLLELEFFNYLKTIPANDRLAYSTHCKIRAVNSKGEYNYISHRTLYLKNSSKGGLWLAVCIYNFNHDLGEVHNIDGRIVNSSTGEITPINTYQNCSDLLSAREVEVLKCVEHGLLSKEIAHRLEISINTVNRHRQNILKRLNVNNSIEAVKTAKALRLL